MEHESEKALPSITVPRVCDSSPVRVYNFTVVINVFLDRSAAAGFA